MAVYDVSPYGAPRPRPASSSPYPASGSGYSSGGSGGWSYGFGSAAASAFRSSPFGSIFSPAALASSFSMPRFGSGRSPASTRVSADAAERRYGTARTATQAAAGFPRTATAEDYNAFLSGTAAGTPPGEAQVPYIGGFPADYVQRQHFPAQRQYGPLEQGNPRDYSVTAFSRPLYPEGSEYAFFARLGVDQIRQWQSFFAGLGFKTGPAGVISQHDVSAMRAFMGMANGIPGGMKVETLRDRVMDQVRAGVYFFRGVNESGDLLPALIGGDAAGDLTGGGGGGGAGTPEYTGPITETVTRNIIQEFSMDQGKLALRNIIAQEIGRAPSDAEVREYIRQLNAAFRADPTVITQVTVTDPITGESTTDITENESNVEPEGMALDFAEDVSPEERQEYQTGRYFETIMSAIGM